MMNVMKFFGVIAIVAIIGLGFTSCDGSDDDGIETIGRLTINDIPLEFNNKYVYAAGEMDNDIYLLGVASTNNYYENLIGGHISNGTVTLKVYMLLEDETFSSFNISGNAKFHIYIFSSAHSDNWEEELGNGFVETNFINGIGSGSFKLYDE